MINSTLCYLEKDSSFLMLYRNKKENDPCEGKWVGIGGKFEEGETAEECLLREVFEETGLRLTEYCFCGVIHFLSDELPDEDMYLYTASQWQGSLDDSFECSEGKLSWIKKDEVLDLNLWEGDKYFLEPLIQGMKINEMTCRYEGDKCVEHKIGGKND